MNTTTNLINHQQALLQAPRVAAIDSKDLRLNDIILIGTQNTRYSFLITSERGMRGSLSGDSRENFFPEAVLIGSLVKAGNRTHTLMERLQSGAHALFFVKREECLMELLTSQITSLCCIRAGGE